MSRTMKTTVRQGTKPCKIVLQIELKMILSAFVIDVESIVITSSRLDCDEFLKGTGSVYVLGYRVGVA